MIKDIRIEIGIHSSELFKTVQDCWRTKQALILIPPYLKDQIEIPKDLPPEMQIGLFTSGTSTGKPRLILYSRENILSSLTAIRNLFVEPIDQIFCYPQPSHVFGLTLGYIHAIEYNIPCVFQPGPYSKTAHQLWASSLTPQTLTLGTPVHFLDALSSVKNPIASYSSIIGGAPVSSMLWKKINSELYIRKPSIGYGASEASPGITHLPPGIEPEFEGDVGYLLEGVSITGKNDDGFKFTGKNKCIGIIADGKLKSENEILISDQIDYTGKDQRICVYGRSDLAINRGGAKFFPEIIESYLLNEGIKAVVVPLFDERLGQDVGLLVESSETDQKENIKNLIKNKFQVVIKDQFIVFDQIPLNDNLKVSRKNSLKAVLRQQGYELPFSPQKLKQFMPHRGSAIWLDEVNHFNSNSGQGRVYLKSTATYVTNNQLRPSALIEFVAQAYGYSFVMEEIFNRPQTTPAEQTMLAEVRDVKFYGQEIFKNLKLDVDYLDIVVECTRDFIKIKNLKGKVFHKGQLLIDLTMKVVLL